MTEKNPFETHKGVEGQDDVKNKTKTNKGIIGAGAKVLDWSNQDESSFEDLDVAKTEELAENDPGEPGEGSINTGQVCKW